MKTTITATIFALFMLVSLSVDAQSLQASVNRSKVAVGQTFQITFELKNGGGGNFQPPAFEDFKVLSGPNQSTSMSIVNGNMTQSISYSYHLSPKTVGNFDIGPAFMQVKKKKIQSNIVTVQVVKGNQNSAGNNQGGNQSNDLDAQIGESVFVRLIVDESLARIAFRRSTFPFVGRHSYLTKRT